MPATVRMSFRISPAFLNSLILRLADHMELYALRLRATRREVLIAEPDNPEPVSGLTEKVVEPALSVLQLTIQTRCLKGDLMTIGTPLRRTSASLRHGHFHGRTALRALGV